MPMRPELECGQCNAIALALGADALVLGHLHVLEQQRVRLGRPLAELFFLARDDIAFHRFIDDEAGDALAASRCVGHREQHRAPRNSARRDELLGAVDDVAIALLHRSRAQVRSIGPGLRFGQREGAHVFAGGKLAQPAVLLCVGAVLVEDDAGRGVVHAHHGGNGAIAGGDLLEEQRIGDGVDLGAVPLRRRGGAEDAEFSEFADDLRFDGACLLAGGGVGRQPVLGELADHVDDDVVLHRFHHKDTKIRAQAGGYRPSGRPC